MQSTAYEAPIKSGRRPSYMDFNRCRLMLRKVLAERPDGPQTPTRLYRVISAMVTAAEEGKMDATKQILDRMDGRPREQVDVTDGAGRVIARVVFGGLDDPPAETPVIEQTKVIDVSPSVADVQK